MCHRKPTLRSLWTAWLAASCCAFAAPFSAHAEDAPVPGLPTSPTPNATINLIRLMVEQKLIPAEAAAKLIAQAEAEAREARAALAQNPAPPAAVAASAPAATPDGTVRVTYIPPHIRRQMVEEVRHDVMSQAVDERWADPRALPEWTTRWKPNGDIRLRYETVSFPEGNAGGLDAINVTSLNAGRGLQMNSAAAQDEPIPYLNADQDRQRLRVRARLGADIDLQQGFSSGLRAATGESGSPVSQNQSLGGGNGNFSKYSLWLDRAFLKYDGALEHGSFSVTGGRFANPFFSTSMLWSNDLSFDGLVLQGRDAEGELKPFATLGLLPVYNTAFDLSTNRAAKTASSDKWLYAAQLGADWKINKDFEAKFAVAYYHFENIEGETSSPTDGTVMDAGDTDGSRLLFAQKGNTYRLIRDLNAPVGTTKQFNYFGLAAPFREVALTGRIDYNHFDPVQISLLVEVVKNVAIDEGEVAASSYTFNNLTPSGDFGGGDFGAFAAIQFGHALLENRWDWNVTLGYRHVETDAVVDGFADSDFGGGGTNVKGFTLGGNLSLSPNVWVGARLMSSDNVSGPTLRNDTVQFDLNGRF